MGMNIKNREAERLVRELAEKTGQNQTAAIIDAVREKLQRLDDVEARIQRLKAISREIAPLFKEPYRSVDHGELLYDEKTGLPK